MTENDKPGGEQPDGTPSDAAAPTTPQGAPPVVAEERNSEYTERPSVMREILSSNWLMTLLAVVAALVISAILIVAANPEVRNAAGYLFAKPGDFFKASWDAIYSSYSALFRGAVFDFQADKWGRRLRPITETMVSATPLIFAALGLGIGFRSGLFNIGAQGQVLMGAMVATWVGFTFQLPWGVHLLLALLGALLAGGLWAGVAGFLKARTGANEVIVTIMLNWIATYLVAYLLTTSVLRKGGSQPITPPVEAAAMFPKIPFLPGYYRIHFGFLLALLAAWGVWWLMERSTIGFQYRAVGANPDAARTAGINVNVIFVWVMVTAGMLAGLGGASIILGTDKTLQGSSAGSVGFDAITVALLGRSKPVGTVLAALLFGALRAGSPLMQADARTPIDIVLVIQAVIVLFIAAPPLVRRMFFLPSPGVSRKEVAA